MIQLPDHLGGLLLPKPNRNLIALMGERKRGKDYLAKYLIQKYGAVRLSFSDNVRILVNKVFPWFDAFSIADEDKDKPYIHPMNPLGKTPREIIKLVGKVRDVHPSRFVYDFIKTEYPQVIENPKTLYVITDFRTIDEDNYLITPLNIPVLKIISSQADAKYPHDEFESYLRDRLTSDVYHNNMDGMGNFSEVFVKFAKKYKLNGLSNE